MPRKVLLEISTWTLREPFITAQERCDDITVLTVTIEQGTHRGRGEALGVDYLGEDAGSIGAQARELQSALEAGMGRTELQQRLPPGGARNAIDCALWDLACQQQGRRAWDLAGVTVKPVHTAYTLALDSAASMARQAAIHADKPVLKLKLDREAPAAKIAAVRAARPDAELLIDANGGWDAALLEQLGPTLRQQRISMVEQPLPRGQDQALAQLDCPVPLCADESCQHLGDLEAARARYDMVNIKLDKSGGLTEALAMRAWCLEQGCDWMVGNMLGSSRAMAPAFLLTAGARWVDLDGPLWQRHDCDHPIRFDGSLMHAPRPDLWG